VLLADGGGGLEGARGVRVEVGCREGVRPIGGGGGGGRYLVEGLRCRRLPGDLAGASPA
jgi:hypothetical protein